MWFGCPAGFRISKKNLKTYPTLWLKAPSSTIRAWRRRKDIFTNHHWINEWQRTLSSPWTRPFFTSCCAAVRPVSLASLFTPEVAIASSSIKSSELASLKRPLTNPISSPNWSSLRQSPLLQSFILYQAPSASIDLHQPPSASISLHQPPSVVILSLLGAILPNWK